MQHIIWKADLGLLFCCLEPEPERYLLLIPKDSCVGFQATFGAYAVMSVFNYDIASLGASRMSSNTVHIPFLGIGRLRAPVSFSSSGPADICLKMARGSSGSGGSSAFDGAV